MGYSTPKKIFVSVIIGAVFFVSVFLIYSWGFFSGAGKANSEVSPVMAQVVYDFAAKGEYQHLEDSSLCTPEVISRFQELEKKNGRIRSFKIIDAAPGVLGIPVCVDVIVERTHGTFEELLISYVSTPYGNLSERPYKSRTD